MTLATVSEVSLEADLQRLTDISEITVDDSVIDVSEVENEEDREFLLEMGHQILLTDAKADFAIAQITKKIRGRASLEKGKFIDAIQQRFGSLEGKKNTGLQKFWHSLGFWESGMAKVGLKKPSHSTTTATALYWARAYRAITEAREMFGDLVDPDAVLAASDMALARVEALPTDVRQQVLAEIVTGENVPSEKEVKELAAKPEVKLSKAQELLAKAKEKQAATKERIEEVKSDPEVSSNSSEYNAAYRADKDAGDTVKKLEQQIEDLKLEIQIKAVEANAAAKAEAEAKAELEALQKDDDTTRRRRINELSQTLTDSLPEAQGDLLRFFAEQDYYEKSYKKAILETAQSLYKFLGEHLNGQEG